MLGRLIIRWWRFRYRWILRSGRLDLEPLISAIRSWR